MQLLGECARVEVAAGIFFGYFGQTLCHAAVVEQFGEIFVDGFDIGRIAEQGTWSCCFGERTNVAGQNRTALERCFDHGFSIDADRVVLTEEMVRAFHEHGLEVGVWTVNEREDLEKYRAMNVDYIESDVFGGND